MKKLFENWRKHLNETTFQDEIKRIEQQYGVSILVSDAEGRYGVSVMHRDEDQLPGEQYPNYSKQPVSYENLEQAEEDIKSRQAQQKMSFKEELTTISEADDTPLGTFLRQQPTEPLEYKDMPPEQQIELGEAAEQIIEIYVGISPGLRSHLKDLVVLNMDKIAKMGGDQQ